MEKIRETNDNNYELDPSDEVLNPEESFEDLWDKSEDSKEIETFAKTDTFEIISKDYLREINELERDKKELIERLHKEGLIDKKSWEGVVLIFKDKQELLEANEIEEIRKMMFREFKVNNKRDRRMEGIGLEPVEKTNVIVKKKAA
ncbi:MAG: hypothetical protein FJZ43_01495 [Candidatus Staskawiczbacteria bacterium]|nr:hypothetical protein [Candidatus Staskawiczbacteria bacterium]